VSRIVVQDANIFIDLQAGNLLEAAFRLDCSFHTTDAVLDEVVQRLDRYVTAGNLTVAVLSGDELIEVVQLRASQPRRISMEDTSLIALASKLDAVLLTGDGNLRFCAEKAKIEVHGTLWMMDLMVGAKLLTPKQAATALQKMIKANRRLPTDECQARLKRWQ